MRTRRLLGLGAAFMCACALALAMTVTAFAADGLNVTGINNNEPSDSATAVLTVQLPESQEKTSLYVDIYGTDGKIMAKRLQVDADKTGVVAIKNLPSVNAPGLKLVVFDDGSQKANELYTGTIQGVYAKLQGVNEPILIGTRTTATAWSETEMRNFVPQGSINENNLNYKLDLVDGKPAITTVDGKLCYSYSSYSPEATATGTISFVDQDSGKELDRRTYAGIKTNESVKVNIPATVANKNDSSDHNVYRTLYIAEAVVLNNPNNLNYVVQCKATGSEFDPTFHIVNVNFVSGTKLLATDKVSVTGAYQYTVPSSIEQYDGITGVYTQYTLASTSPSVIDLSNKDLTEVNVYYDEQPHDRETITVTYNQINATKSEGPDRLINTETKTVSAANPTATPSPTATLSTGEEYVLAGNASQYTYTYGKGGATVINAYYVPKDYKPPKAYDVTVNYVNLANNTVIGSQTATAQPNTDTDLVINIPATYAKDGENYVRLDGQGNTINHNFYSGAATYTVYYRNVNDNLTKNVVITRINVVYDTVTGTATGTTTATGTGAAPLQTGTELTAVNPGNGGGTITNSGGTDSQTIRDNENPLAAGNNANKGFSIEKDWPLVAGGVCLLAALAIIIAVIANNRKKKANEAAANDGK